MKLLVGHTEKKEPFFIDFDKSVNGHILLMGMSGAGKTHRLRDLIAQMYEQSKSDLSVHIFDVHGDIDVAGSSEVVFSEVSPFGINPFILNTDIHEGGVRKRIQSFVNIIRRTSYVLGDKQEAVLRNIVTDLFEEKGFSMTDPSTWDAAIPTDDAPAANRIFLVVPYEEKDDAKKCGAKWSTDPKGWYIDSDNYKGEITRWKIRDELTVHSRTYPSLGDVVAAAQNKTREVYLGVGSDAFKKLDAFHNAANKFNSLQKKLDKHVNVALEEEVELAKKTLEKSAESVKLAVDEYLSASKSNKELEDSIKYNSLDVLKSVTEKLENLKATGLFKNKQPAFTSCIKRHNLKALFDDEQKMYVLISLERLFEDAKRKGPCNYIRDIYLLDEAAKFFSEDESNILNIIAREARKFGVAMICASQAPTHFSDDFISSVGTKIILGIDEMFWDSSTRKLRVSLDDMASVQPRKKLLIQVKTNGEARNNWQQVLL